MSTENIEKICKYKEDLEKKLKELQNERKQLLQKFNNGEILSKKETKRNQELIILIKDVQKELESFKNIESINQLSNLINKLSENTLTKDEKETIIKKILAQFKKMNADLKEDLKNKTCLTDKGVKHLDEVKKDLNEEINDLNAELRAAKRKNYNTSDIEEEIEDKENILNAIKEYEDNLLYLDNVNEDLKTLANNSTPKDEKTAILILYNNIIYSYKEMTIENIKNIVNLEDEIEILEIVEEEPIKGDKKTLKERTKEKSKKLSEFLKTNAKKIAAIGGTVVLCVAIILIAKSCSKNIENSKDDNLENKSEIEQLYENVNRATVKSLINKGYSEYHALLMANNFDEQTIEALQNVPFIEKVEEYSTSKDFNIDYLNDYETAREIYNIPCDKAVDYVNRSAKIEETGFYNDATINDIVEVLIAIDNKELFTQNNANLAQSFNTTFNSITNNYLFGNVTNENIKLLNAIPYFAAEGTDMNLFLKEFAELAKANIENSNDKEAKDKMYKYIATYALSLNGFSNKDEDIKISTPYNKNAQLNDYFDWYIAYNSFIAPLYPTFVDENDFSKYEELQYTIYTAMEDPQFREICGQSRTLGGE